MKKYIFYLIVFVSLPFLLSHCTSSDASDGGELIGQGGSLNKFTIIDSFLYVINFEYIESYEIFQGEMNFIDRTHIDANIETVFPFDSLLLVGGQQGMYICKRSSSGSVELISTYEHVESCDPVVTDGQHAYVTLSSGCNWQNNQLDILDVTNPYQPILLATYPMEGPKGLGISNNLLFICDTPIGLKIYDRTDPVQIELKYLFDHIQPIDVIPYQGLLFVMTSTAIHQFDYSNPNSITELSSFTL